VTDDEATFGHGLDGDAPHPDPLPPGEGVADPRPLLRGGLGYI